MPQDNGSDALREQLAALSGRVSRLEAQLAELTGRPLPAGEAVRRPPSAAPTAPPPAQATAASAAPQPVAAAVSGAGGRIPEPGLESRIGSQWLNRIGIVAVLVGVSYFLKFAFENNWIGPAGRVAIGLLAGIAVVAWSERFRAHGHVVFSYSLKALGVGVLYLSLWAAFQVYSLVPAGAAFFAMVVVTAATAVIALRQDAEIIAAFALLGGFATPVLVSTGQNREIELFSYVALLDAATLALVAFRPWSRLALGSFGGTLALYIGWYAEYYTPAQLGRTLPFAALFFALFAAVAPAASRRAYRSSAILVLPLLNAAVFFVQLYALLAPKHHDWLAWAAVALAGVYVAVGRAIEGGTEAQRRLLGTLHLAVAVGFITIAIPLKLEAHWITLGWLVESGLLLWVGSRARAQLLVALGFVALALGVFRLLAIDDFHPAHAVFNARFLTYLVAIAVLAGIYRFGGPSTEPNVERNLRAAAVAANVLALVALTREISDVFARAAGQDGVVRHDLDIARNFAYSALYMLYGAALMFAGFWRHSAFLRWQALVLVAVTIAKVFVYDVSELDRVYRILSFIVLGVLLLGISFAYQRDWFKLMRGREESPVEGA